MKTIKTYKSPCLMIINVTVGDKNRQINFDPCAIGGSSYTTDSENLQKAIECHSLFGSRIFLGGVEKVSENEDENYNENENGGENEQLTQLAQGQECHEDENADAEETAEAQVASEHNDEEAEQAEGPEKVEVTDIDEAKEYLKTRFKAKASQVKTTSMVLEYAHEHGVEFVGL